MKILSNKKYKELEMNRKTYDMLANGYRANMMSLSYERAIVQILKQYNLKELEIPKSYIMNNETLSIAENPAKDTIIIRLESEVN